VKGERVDCNTIHVTSSFDRSRIRHVAGALQVNRACGRVADIADMWATPVEKLSRVVSSVAQRCCRS